MEYEKFTLGTYIDVDYIICCFHSRLVPPGFTPLEHHDFWEMVYAERGHFKALASGKMVDVPAGCAVFHAPGEEHQHHAVDAIVQIDVISFYIKSNVFNGLNARVIEFSDEAAKILHEIMSIVGPTNFAPPDTLSVQDRQKIKLNLELLLLEILRISQGSAKNNHISSKNYEMIKNVMQENVYKRLTTADIALLCNLSESNLKKTFRQYSGEGIMTAFNRLKIIEAKKLLRLGLSVNAVSNELAFSSPGYFSVFFKRETGISPFEYKSHADDINAHAHTAYHKKR